MLHPTAMTLDLEEHFHADLVRRARPRALRRSRASEATLPLLEALDRHGVPATFFVVGEVLRAAPGLVAGIAAAGHRIACHGDSHRPLWDLGPRGLSEELRRFRHSLREVDPSLEALAFRAPSFSFDRRSPWLIRVLADHGFRIDSSLLPARTPLGGWPGAPPGIYRPDPGAPNRASPTGPVVEFPAAVVEVGARLRLPIGGGIYLRLLPFDLWLRLFRRVLRRRPAFVYLHPWEADPDTPRLPLPRPSRWLTYARADTMRPRFERLLQALSFEAMERILDGSEARS